MNLSKGDIVINDKLSLTLTNDDVTESLPVKSYIRIHKIFVVEQRLIKGKVSSLKISKYQELIKRINQIIE